MAFLGDYPPRKCGIAIWCDSTVMTFPNNAMQMVLFLAIHANMSDWILSASFSA